MSWTYDVTLLNSTPKYQVRMLVRDTDTTRQLVQDEEIEFVLSSTPNIYFASAIIADMIAKQYALQPDTKTDIFSETYNNIAPSYAKLAESLRKEGMKSSNVSFYAGGISVTDKTIREEDSDRVAPYFTRIDGDNNDWY